MQRDALRAKRLMWLLVVPALGWGFSVRAQTPGAQLHVATATGATTFHIGERIPLQLEYTASPDAHLAVTTKSYDRSGRMSVESFEVSPSSGFIDPLAAYFGGGLMMGGIYTVQELSGKPYTMHLDLNEWVRFDTPGDYTVVVHSSRVFKPGRSPFPSDPQMLISNPVKLHIIPATAEWQKATLAHAVQALAVKHNPYGPVPEEIAGAIADVRFLGSADSIPVLVAGLGEDQTNKPFTFALGLIGLPPALKDVARRVVRERIDDPEVAVSIYMLMAYGGLETNSAGSGDGNYFQARRVAQEEGVQAAIAALPRKTGKAKAATADVLLRGYTGSLTPEDKAAIARALGAGFAELPEDKQAILLAAHWDLLRPAITAQTLEQIASLPVTDPASRVMPAYNRVQLKSEALSRWYELDPEAAKRAAYAQIGSAKPSLTASKLWFLPAEPLPQYESIWAQGLLGPSEESNAEVLAALMTRFGTGAFASQVAAKVRGSLGEEACAAQEAMLAYVVKFKPELARPLLHDAIEARGETRCYAMVIGEMPQYTTSPVLTDVAIESVADADPDTVMSALRYLMAYGDQRGQAPILNRYISWTQEWAGRSDELDANPFKPSPNHEQEQLGEMLGRALLGNEGWITDERLRAEVVKRCVGEQMCRSLQQNYRVEGPPYAVTLFQQEGREVIHVGPYEIPNLELVRAKLSQYPRGTAFALIQPDSSADMQRFEKQVRAVFDDAGMTLTKKP